MGLDIMAISNLEKKPKIDKNLENLLPPELRQVPKETRIKIDTTPYGSEHGGFNKCDDMEGGKYAETDETTEHHFRAGSYTGYGRFRKLLSNGVAGVEVDTIWKNQDQYKDSLMFEMINFSDCEGILGTGVCKKLHTQFLDNREKFENYLKETFGHDVNQVEWEMETYDNFTKAFKLGSQNGIVVYG